MTKQEAVLTAMAAMGERPADAARSLQAFNRSASILSSNTPRLIDEYPDQWVAVCDGRVVAHGKKLTKILRETDNQGVAREDIIVRFIERTQRTLIL